MARMTGKILNMAAAAAFFIAAATLPASCQKENPEGNGQETPDTGQAAEVLGTYEFDGKTYDILTAAFTENESYYTFVFSPLSKDRELSTSLLFSIRTYWGDGEQHKVGTLDQDHNDDYIIVYEDPVHLYSQFREPQSGTYSVTVPDDRSGVFHVCLDVCLADGTPLKMDYKGTMSLAAGSEE